MVADAQAPIDWQDWLRRWDVQQTGYVPEREQRFTVMFDALAALLPEAFVALDLACGPGSLSRRLLDRFTSARAVAVDMDPVVLALGKGAIGTVAGRLRWVDADLATPGWVEALGEPRFDAVLSTTALHWLTAEQLVGVYRNLGQLLRPGGVLLNGDNMAFGPHLPTFQRLGKEAQDRDWSDAAFAARGIETSEQWWADLEKEPSMAELLHERAQRLAAKQRQESPPIFDLHVAALRDAGFREIGTLWQSLTNRVLLAVR
jgi:SAM-dependent methyltransferase